MCLEKNFIDMPVVVDNVEFGRRKMKAPVAKILVYDVDGVVFECRVEACAFENFA